MTLWRYWPYLLTTLILLAIPQVWAAAEGDDHRAGLTNSHASLKAYPNAVVSLKDPKTGNLFYVESDGRRLVAFDKDGTVLWNVDPFKSLENTPLIGQPVVRHLKLNRDQLTVTIGKHAYVEIEIRGGKATLVGAD